jgi:hypothetical protein
VREVKGQLKVLRSLQTTLFLSSNLLFNYLHRFVAPHLSEAGSKAANIVLH